MSLKVDTGAQINVTCQDDLSKLSPLPETLKDNIHLKSYQGEDIPCLGLCNLTFQTSKGDIPALFAIVPTGFHSVLGLSAAIQIGVIVIPQGNQFTKHQLHVNAIKTETQSSTIFRDNIAQEVFQAYHTIFEGIGSFGEPYSIKLAAGYTPVVTPVRKVPFLKKES